MKIFSRDIHDEPKIYFERNALTRASEGQCDCACVESVPLKHFPNSFDRDALYTVGGELHRVAVGSEHFVLLSPYGGSLLLNRSANKLLNLFLQPTRAVDIAHQDIYGPEIIRVVEQLFRLGILIDARQSAMELISEPNQLTSWLHVSDRCNLRCAYCYLPHHPKDMLLETGKQVVDATFRSAIKHGFKSVKLKYAGGEPLLRFSFIEALHPYAQILARRHHLELDAVVLSNGTLLTDVIVTKLQKLNLRLMVSLDGLGRFQDAQRSYAGGHGTFSDTARGIELATSLGLIPDISVTVTGQSARGLPALVEWLLVRDLPFSLNFYRENDFSESRQELHFQEAEIINGMLAAFGIIENKLPKRSLLSSLIDRADLSMQHTHTCGVGHSYLVFDYKGQVAKCQMHLDHTITTVEVDDPLAHIQVDQIGIQNVSVMEKEGCRNCQWKNWCAGGCPLATYRATGRYDIKSPNCNIYKSLFPEALRLEGLRLMQKFHQSKVTSIVETTDRQS